MLHSAIHFYDKTHPHGLWILVSEQRGSAVKLQRPAVNRMKKGSSFFGYTDTS